MTDWTAAQIKELIGVQICAERRHRDVLRADDRQWLRDTLAEKDKALKLQAASYPTVEDFNKLKTHVEVSTSGSSATRTTVFQILGLLNAGGVLLLAYLALAK